MLWAMKRNSWTLQKALCSVLITALPVTFQNVRNYKTEEAKLKSLLYGGIAQVRTQAAFDLCTAYASKGRDAFLLN